MNLFRLLYEDLKALAHELAEKESDEKRKQELILISKNCRNISVNPPSGFYEALQLTWFVQLVLQIESNGHSVSLGRLDQYLWKFYNDDVATGQDL